MSNWSLLMISWPGLDDDGTAVQDLARLLDIVSQSGVQNWRTHFACPHPEAIGGCCKFAAITHQSKLDVEGLFEVLDKFEWEYPEDVNITWDREDAIMISYRLDMWRGIGLEGVPES